MALRAFQTKNLSVDGHAVNDNFVCLYNRRKATITEKRMENDVEIEVDEELLIFTVTVHHFFAETISKGKKSDHSMHNTCFDGILKMYKLVIPNTVGVPLHRVKCWTDNAPSQY